MGFIKYKFNDKNNEVQSFTFSGGEVQVKNVVVTNAPRKVDVDAQIQNSEDIMKLLLTCEALKAEGNELNQLTLPYVPYARQDRRCNLGEAHSLKVFAGLINGLGFKEVKVLDPHSDVVEALIENVFIYPQEWIVKDVLEEFGQKLSDRYLISPDGGALKKIYKVAKHGNARGVIKADKVRDVQTGKIISVEVKWPQGGVFSQQDKFLVVDDLVDGGASFVEIAKALKEDGVQREELELYVTHGIFSKGIDELLQYYSTIYTTNSFKDFEARHPNLKIHNIW